VGADADGLAVDVVLEVFLVALHIVGHLVAGLLLTRPEV
jgi:hypothetical protein